MRRPRLAAYTARLRTDAHSTPALLLAHAYVRYLGDLSSGQTIKRHLAKAYALDPADGAGVQFYVFQQPGTSAAPGTLAHQGVVLRGHGQGRQRRRAAQAAMLQEANVMFTLNAGLFDALRTPANGKPPLQLRPSSPVLGNPTTPVSPSCTVTGSRLRLYDAPA
ncbi:hypothetical protein GLOTRDRAFT_134230 [Gloeophyllum trabeum ATCC 11539]|uniref:Heme oxygenase-like protein n=1 Tax=Gloeophyllum trabeum (strain ATCC 11539 / FP-39264 / Madison 617) TaxID=670483 RepID=S7PRY1_GLOTA|nr:uncharacterized protein GLOTRDRAFT_134230 [Gloeophyllum trabeum ATCC 11539]EPQ50132.1 hypothetical protein GLOTRDRAFT_134230 [Gloeophyllum trabeum ATCC 11539]